MGQTFHRHHDQRYWLGSVSFGGLWKAILLCRMWGPSMWPSGHGRVQSITWRRMASDLVRSMKTEMLASRVYAK